MASGKYDQTTGVVGPLTSEQRQRLEALTFARNLAQHRGEMANDHVVWLDMAEWIVTGRPMS